MAVRKFSTRHIKFLLGLAANRAFPPLRARMPFYDSVVPMIDVAKAEVISEEQPVVLDAEGAAFARRLPESDRPPSSIERSLALITLENVTLLGSTGAVLDEANGRVLSPRGARDFVTYHNFRLAPTTLVRKPSGNYFDMVGSHRGHRHFFHFLLDRLPRLYYLLHRFDLGREQVTVLTNTGLPEFQREIYRFIEQRFSNVRFEAVPKHERWLMPRLYHLDDYQPIKRTLADPAVLDFFRSLVFEGFGLPEPTRKRRLYVARSDTRRRRIANEAEIMPIIEGHGFQSIAPGKLSFRDQVELFMSAEAVIGPHGAGLTNILFAPKDARVLEIFPSHRVKNTYFLLSVSLGQTYRAVIGGKGRRNEWFDVEPMLVERAVKELMAAPPRG